MEYYKTLEGSIKELNPYEVITSADIYKFEALAISDNYVEAKSYYQQSCISCQAQNLEGGVGPALTNIGSRLSQSDLENVIITETELCLGDSFQKMKQD